MPTLKDYEAVLRRKLYNGTLYRNDAKLANWLGVPEQEVEGILDRLVAQGVLSPAGISVHGTEKYRLGFPSHLSHDARRLYRVMLAHTTAEDVVNVTRVSQLAELAGMDVSRTRRAFHELSRAHLVIEDTFGDHRFPVILRRVEC